MKTFYKLATLTLMMTLLALSAFAQEPVPATALANLTEGQGAVASSGNQAWDGLSEFVLIPGASLMGASSTTTALYIGFTGGCRGGHRQHGALRNAAERQHGA